MIEPKRSSSLRGINRAMNHSPKLEMRRMN